MAAIDRRDPRAVTLISRILYGPDQSPLTYRDILNLIQNLGTLDIMVYAPEISQRYGINATNTTPLIAAILRGSQPLIEFLLRAGADINFGGGPVIGTPLDYAIYKDNLPLAESFRQHGAVTEQPVSRYQWEQVRRNQFFGFRPGEGPGYFQAQASFNRQAR